MTQNKSKTKFFTIWIDKEEVKKEFDNVQVLVSHKQGRMATQTQTVKFLIDFYEKRREK